MEGREFANHGSENDDSTSAGHRLSERPNRDLSQRTVTRLDERKILTTDLTRDQSCTR